MITVITMTISLIGHVLRKEDDDWVKKCMEYKVEGPRPTEDQKGPGDRLYERTVKHVK